MTPCYLYSIVNDPNISANDLNHDLDVINQWATQGKMAFNQASEILFSYKKSHVNPPDLIFNGSIVKRVTEHKHLGLQPNLRFDKHLYEKMSIAKTNIGIVKHLNKFLPLKPLNQMYKALVRSHLDYCDSIYHIPHTIQEPPLGVSLHVIMENVEKIQYQAALAVTGGWQGSSRVKLYDRRM